MLRKARKEAGLTQKTVALMLGTTQPNVGKLERLGRVSFIVIERLAAIYAVPLSYFATLDEDTRKDGKYLGMTNQEWSNYHDEYNRPRCRTGPPFKSVRAVSIEKYLEWERI
jgi:transcriptional regulator with XRE-family HTH domain